MTKVSSGPRKPTLAKRSLGKAGNLSNELVGAQKLLKFLTSISRFTGDFSPFNSVNPIFNGLSNTFKAADDLMVATDGIEHISALTNKTNSRSSKTGRKYLWQNCSLELGRTLSYVVSSLGALRVYLSKLNIWNTRYVTQFTVVRNIALIAASLFSVVIRTKIIHQANRKIHFKSNWISLEKLVKADQPNEKQALKVAKVFAKRYNHKLKALNKLAKPDDEKVRSYQLYVDAFKDLKKAEAMDRLKSFCELKKVNNTDAKDDSNSDYLAYKTHNAKNSNLDSIGKRKKAGLTVVNELLKITVIAMGTVFMFTPVGKALQFTIGILGVNVNSLALFRYFYDKQKFPMYTTEIVKQNEVTKRNEFITQNVSKVTYADFKNSQQ